MVGASRSRWTRSAARSGYIVLHIVDLRTGHDLHIPSVQLAHPLSPFQPEAVLERLVKQRWPGSVVFLPTWSGRRTVAASLTAAATTSRSGGARGSSRSRVTAAAGDCSERARRTPSTRRGRRTASRSCSNVAPTGRGRAVGHDDSGQACPLVDLCRRARRLGRRLVARDAATPDWSPDGAMIAFDSPEGVRLVSPFGVDLTSPARRISPPGVPVVVARRRADRRRNHQRHRSRRHGNVEPVDGDRVDGRHVPGPRPPGVVPGPRAAGRRRDETIRPEVPFLPVTRSDFRR